MNHLVNQFVDTKRIDATRASVKDFIVEPATLRHVRNFIEKWHYSKNVNGVRIQYCFGLYYQNALIGAMTYGGIGMAGVWKKYAKKESDLLELNRLCCIDATPKNTESYFIAKTLRWLNTNTKAMIVVSYADPFYGHKGTIYKASNFEFVGQTAPGRVIEFEGKRFHDKALRAWHHS